ncbi:hypothetical protein J6590_003755 [Homalodisca vitripennis]|nr:hypothetical protein J6590_003755 [Homalodisca vitripennis]
MLFIEPSSAINSFAIAGPGVGFVCSAGTASANETVGDATSCSVAASRVWSRIVFQLTRPGRLRLRQSWRNTAARTTIWVSTLRGARGGGE